MSFEQWKEQISNFERIDVRHLQGNFFSGLQKTCCWFGQRLWVNNYTNF